LIWLERFLDLLKSLVAVLCRLHFHTLCLEEVLQDLQLDTLVICDQAAVRSLAFLGRLLLMEVGLS